MFIGSTNEMRILPALIRSTVMLMQDTGHDWTLGMLSYNHLKQKNQSVHRFLSVSRTILSISTYQSFSQDTPFAINQKAKLKRLCYCEMLKAAPIAPLNNPFNKTINNSKSRDWQLSMITFAKEKLQELALPRISTKSLKY